MDPREARDLAALAFAPVLMRCDGRAALKTLSADGGSGVRPGDAVPGPGDGDKPDFLAFFSAALRCFSTWQASQKMEQMAPWKTQPVPNP